MIKLFDSSESNFNHNGLGCLNDAITCYVTDKLNGEYELEMTYPVDGIHYNDIVLDRIIFTKANSYSEQPFRIYSISKPINKIITVNAQHISYDLSNIPVKGALENYAYNVQEVFEYIRKCVLMPCKYTFNSNVTKTGNMCLSKPRSVRSILGTDDGILSIFGGEYEFDMYNVTLHEKRGADRGVCIEYGKNLTDLKQDENNADMYTAIYPFYFVEDDGLQTLDNNLVRIINNPEREKVLTLDLTSEFEEMPTQQLLIEQTQKYIQKNKLNEPKVSLSVSFIKNPEMSESLQDVRLGDTVTVKFTKLGVNSKSRCISTKFNCITDKYDSIELGEPPETLSETVSKVMNQQSSFESDLYETNVSLDDEIERATEAEGQIVVNVEKTAEGIRSEVANMSAGMYTAINQNASAISLEAQRASNAEGALSSRITVTADAIASEVTRATNAENVMSSRITQTADAITAEVTRATGAENSLSSSISIQAGQISSKVSAGDVCSTISQRSDAIDISANRISISSDYFSLTKNGSITSKSGTIGGWTICENALYNNLNNINDISSFGIYFSPMHGLRMNSIPNGGIFLGGINYYSSGGGYRGDQLTLRSNYLDVANSDGYGNKAIMGCWDSSGLPSFALTDSGNGLATKIGTNESYFKGSASFSGKVTFESEATFYNNIVNMAWYNNTSTDASNAHIGSGGRISRVTSSSKRFKHDIALVQNESLDPHKLYDIGIYQYKYNANHLDSGDRRYEKDVIGFIAEDIYEKYPMAADLDTYGEVNDWNFRFMIPPMLKLIQEQHSDIESLKTLVTTLLCRVNILEQKMEVVK